MTIMVSSVPIVIGVCLNSVKKRLVLHPMGCNSVSGGVKSKFHFLRMNIFNNLKSTIFNILFKRWKPFSFRLKQQKLFTELQPRVLKWSYNHRAAAKVFTWVNLIVNCKWPEIWGVATFMALFFQAVRQKEECFASLYRTDLVYSIFARTFWPLIEKHNNLVGAEQRGKK